MLTARFSHTLMLSLIAGIMSGQNASQLSTITVMAVADLATPSIALQWTPQAGAVGYEVYRREVDASGWGSALAALPASADGYVDAAVLVGHPYEYKVLRNGTTTGYGYVRSGISVPETAMRGRLVLLVDAGLAASLSAELQQLDADLHGDGWLVARHDIQPEATPAQVRQVVIDEYEAAPALVKAVYILGHVPVPYSGDIAPDGHAEHQGAWPCDGYYGDMDGIWTDTLVNSTVSSHAWNHNTPGDGKWDQSDLPSAVELHVGRVDFSQLDAFASSEAELTSAYLNKAHAWKTGQFTVPARAVVWDNLDWLGFPIAASGFSSSAPCVGIDSLVTLLPAQGSFEQHYRNADNLLTYHCSTGLITTDDTGSVFPGTEAGLSLSDLLTNTRGGVFNMSMGSYFGDWDNRNNFLRAMNASGNSLVHVWCGIPNWFLHPMAMGETVGYCALRTMNNTIDDYALQSGGFQGPEIGRTHLALMGDPTLRLAYVAPPTALVASNEQWFARFQWSPSPDAVDGYHVYRIDADAGTLSRITPEMVVDTFFVSATVPFVPGDRYMVRAIKLITSPSGTYFDLSLGVQAIAQGVQLADCEGVVGGEAIPGSPCDDGEPGTVGEVYDALCNCVIVLGIGAPLQQVLQAWPCPTAGLLTVRLPEPSGILSVWGINGALVYRIRSNSQELSINTAAFADGSYVLEFFPDQRAVAPVRTRFVVAH
jgi:hypothetical protein